MGKRGWRKPTVVNIGDHRRDSRCGGREKVMKKVIPSNGRRERGGKRQIATGQHAIQQGRQRPTISGIATF